MLTGSDLLAKVKDLGDVSKSDLVRACGYVSTKKDGGERLNFTAFYEALLEAKENNLAVGGTAALAKVGANSATQPRCKAATFLLARPTAMLELNPGDEFTIKLGKKAIRLIPAGETEEGDE